MDRSNCNYPGMLGTFRINEMGNSIPIHWEEGLFCVVERDVIIGRNCRLGHHVILKNGTILGDDVWLADGVMTTGSCSIGSNTNIRTGAIISKGTYIEQDVFIGPGVITNHTRHVRGPKADSENLITLIMSGAVIGSQASIVAGVTIGEGIVVGAGSVVTKDLLEPGTYVGNPARKLK